MCVGAPHCWSNCDTEACGQWDAQMHDLLDLLPGSSLDPVCSPSSKEKAETNTEIIKRNNVALR